MKTPTRRLQPFALADVRIDDGFWAPRQAINRRVGLPHQYRMCKQTGRIDAMRLTWRPGQPKRPHWFWDSDVVKWLEAVGHSLTTHPDAELEKRADGVIDLLAASQQPDGYLNTHFTVAAPQDRWTNLRDMHELYTAGHLMEAAVAYYGAGRGAAPSGAARTFLNVARRLADHVDAVFGPGKRRGYPGHEEIELALVKLFRATGERRYLKLAKYFLDERGRAPYFFDVEARARGEDLEKRHPPAAEYFQAHRPVREQAEAVGHAVRAGYLYSGMADVAAETADAELFAACRRLWNSITRRKMYVTGGVGARHEGEAFGADYEVPNQTAYAETCAAIALIFFAHRMLQIDPDGRYADAMERALYNGALSGMSADGRRFFYVNPLASAGGHHRQPWFGCACCPTNLTRLLASLGHYVYSAADRAAYVHLYVGGEGSAEVAGQPVTLRQQTDYPWDGRVRITVSVARPVSFSLMLRIPGWCERHQVKVSGRAVTAPVAKGYARIRRRWADGDTVELSLAMPVVRLAASRKVADDARRVALQRGPLVYCLEQADHAADVRSIVLPDRARLTAQPDAKLPGGCVVITGRALAVGDATRPGQLYSPARRSDAKPVKLKAIPYFLWDNRRAGPMTVWIPRA